MKLGESAGAVGWVLLLGACEVHVQTGQAPPPPPPPPPHVAAAPAPPPPAQHPAPPPPQPVPPPRPVMHFAARIVHPPPLQNMVTARLNVPALKLKLRPNRRCGPRETPVNSGHWIHLDCNPHAALTRAKPPSQRKVRLLMAGMLKLDSPVRGNALPDAVDHRTDGTEGPIKDQGQVGSCTAFSLSSAMDNAIRRQNKGDTTSSLHIWSHYGYPAMQNAGDGNEKKPIANWEIWPYDERIACELDQSGDGDCGPYTPPVIPGSSGVDGQVQAKIKDSDSKGHWQVTEYDQVQPDPDTIAGMLATGADVWFSMNIGSTWMSPSGDSIGDWTEDQVEGGHAILFSGYRHKNGQRQFLVHNSWGKDWGDGGFAYISEGMLRSFIKTAYKVVVSNGSQPPPPQPQPSPQPQPQPQPQPPPSPSDPNELTDDDCGEDQLVDSVTGQCAQICPDDSRPANGQCGGTAGAKKPTAPPPTAPHGVPLKRR